MARGLELDDSMKQRFDPPHKKGSAVVPKGKVGFVPIEIAAGFTE